MYQFNWDNFDERAYNKAVKYCRNASVFTDDYVGAARVGDLCFDLVFRETDNDAERLFTYDLYVGGVDNGYDYGIDGYPYEFCDGGCFCDESLDLPYEEFKKYAEKEMTDYINSHSSWYDLGKKALEPLHIW